MNDGSRDDRRTQDAARFDKAQPNQPQQNQGSDSGRQQGGFPHEDGGWGQAEQDLLRDQQNPAAMDGDEETGGGKARQRQARPTGI
ncbi:MAG: hypothetical protein ACT6XY_22345 [Phreatobacter sp.]|uniref:hypothetical protein n=1 Tax=Phreatobacter sp. TaxID=1966341 RepID=UPI0040370D6B